MTNGGRTLARGLAIGALLAGALAPAAAASPFDPSGVLRLVGRGSAHLNTNQSSNWFGYNQGAIEQGGKLFSSVAADWTVPAVSQHTAGQAGSSATWVGVGGGCIDAGCVLQDVSVIQAGTEQDVDSSGHASYSAWWELVPAPAITISNVSVSAGDRVHASVSESSPGSELWTITFKDVTRNQSFTTTLPYSSTHSSAEWIEETPLTIGAGGTGEASLPKLSSTRFDNATANGAPPHLTPGEQLQLADAAGKVIGAPSAPDAESDGFAACAWAASCAVQASSSGGARSAHKPAHHRTHRRTHRGSRRSRKRHRR